ncbi:two-component system, chemotaxis family, sensor kinase CheA [Bryocella elongata]|uniref:Chemotaxis protein CheA n=2 Tax=Bryocella elongata TaxID=863522 RepID=A0A1H5TGQ6_9BACT|nr:two-component system, chemotaxis family, sensor kinase CheA [Bryocella elongata]
MLQAVDDLALQVMLKGAAAFRSKAMASILEVARKTSPADFVVEMERLVKLAKAKTLTDEDARNGASALQAILAPPPAPPVPEPAAPVPFEEDAELLNDFVLEAEEHLTSIEERILQLEKDPSLTEAIHAVFRSFHSIKGLAGFLGLDGVQAVAHEVETLLDHARNARVSVDSAIVDLVLEAAEYLKDEVAAVQARLSGSLPPVIRNNVSLLASVRSVNEEVQSGRRAVATAAAAEAATVVAVVAPVAEPVAPVVDTAVTTADVSESSFHEEEEVVAFTLDQEEEDQAAATAIAAQPAVPVEVVKAAPAPVAVVAAPKAVPAPAPSQQEPMRVEVASTSVRVETSKLDRLMDMVGEMVIAQSILMNLSRASANVETRMAGELAQLARITTEVQRCAMSMRMMPIGPLFQKNAKMVRDLSRRNGKKVNLELAGESTELDKTIAEELADPLLHMIRNALDHGIEPPQERLAVGKSEMATLKISAEHEAGQIVVSISDDGRGLNPDKIRNKALERGLIDENQHLSEQEIFHLIFAPGFSTAEKITDISGRGVGMDVVRQHVEHLRGRILIESELGKGTTFYIHLPLTLAIIEGLVIVVGDHRYIIPLFSVREMCRPTEDMLFTVQGQDEMILMRGSLLPLVRLHRRFYIEPKSETITDGLLVVCEFAGKRFCLFVDDLLGRQEVVIKSLDEAFKSVRGLAGSAILGDGRIGLILDVAGIFSQNGFEGLAA